MAGSIQSPPFLSAYSTVEEAGRKYGREKRAICIRGLKWTRRGLEEVDKKGETRIKRGGKKRRGSRGSGEKRGSPGTGFVMLNRLSQPMFSLSPPPPLSGEYNSQSQGNRLQGSDLLNFRAG